VNDNDVPLNFELPPDCVEMLKAEVKRRGGDPNAPEPPLAICREAMDVLEAASELRGISKRQILIEVIRTYGGHHRPRTKPGVRKHENRSRRRRVPGAR
jgi:hypothetical protein